MPARSTETVRIGGKPVTLSNPDKVLWPADGYTKGDLVEYYRAVSKWILPYLKDRPLSLERYPNGIRKPGFFEKNAPKSLPPFVKTVSLKAGGKRPQVRYVLCNDEATLAYLANLAAIALHAFMSHTGSLDHPDFTLFDLDRGDGCPLSTLATVALLVRDELRKRKLTSQPKTTGGSGLHVFAWTRGRFTYEQGRALTNEVALAIEAAYPKLVTLERMIAKRPRGRVYMDWAQVALGKTVVMPFVVRARDRAPVSMPLRWSDVEKMRRSREMDTAKVFSRWNISTVPKLLQRQGDPWKS